MLVFVYGTLTDPERAASVLDEWRYAGEAVLHGLHRVDGRYPTLAPGGRVEGRLLATDEVRRLDAYEGVDGGLYVRVAVPLRSDDDAPADGPRNEGLPGGAGAEEPETAAVYVGDPDPLGAAAGWPGEGDFEARVSAYLDAEDVVIRWGASGGRTREGS